MAKKDLEAKKELFAKIIEGNVVDDSERVAVLLRGNILGFPATLEATEPGFPFGSNFFVQTDVLKEHIDQDPTYTITITPKFARGLTSVLGRLLMIDAHERPTGSAIFDGELLAHATDNDICQRLIHYPGMSEKLRHLHQFTNFRELHIQGKQGISMVCPTSFSQLSYDVAREAFIVMGDMAQTLFEAF